MIRWTRSLRIASVKYNPQVVQWAKEIAEFINKKYKVQFSVYIDIFGEFGTIRWFSDYADMAAIEKFMNQINTDKEYWQKVNQASDFFIQGSAHDIMMRAI
jgi:hypothetical protein